MKNHILISDSQQLFKESIYHIINEINTNYVFQQHCLYKTLKQDVKKFNNDLKLVILSTNLFDINNINKTVSELATLTTASILVITSIDSSFFASEIIKSGATCCLVKTATHNKYKEIISAILSDKTHIPQSQKKTSNNHNKLTKRQYEILSEVAQGLLNKEIAGKLSISESTVKIHISSILMKLSVNNRTKAAIKFFQEI